MRVRSVEHLHRGGGGAHVPQPHQAVPEVRGDRLQERSQIELHQVPALVYHTGYRVFFCIASQGCLVGKFAQTPDIMQPHVTFNFLLINKTETLRRCGPNSVWTVYRVVHQVRDCILMT